MDYMLTVIEQQQETARLEMPCQGLDHRFVRSLLDAQRCRHDLGHEAWVSEWRKFDHPHTIVKSVYSIRNCL